MLLEINRGIPKKKKIRLRLTIFEKIESEVKNIADFSKNTKPREGES